MGPGEVRISCLPRVAAVALEWGPSHVLSLIDPDLPASARPRFAAPIAHDVFTFFDQENPDGRPAFLALCETVVDRLQAVCAAEGPARLLIHCHAGASRSTAAGYIALSLLAGPGREVAAFDRLLAMTVKPWPNRLLVEVADRRLGRDGALLAPLDAYRGRYPRRIDAYHRLNPRRGLISTVRR